MTEFAFSGLGLNPHFGTPANPFDRHTRRIPGGSSSGAAVSVTDEMAFAALGTDTGGSCRIPAAFCGIVGFKPTARRVPQRGVFPLAPSLDSIGPLARSVDCCAAVDRILSSTANTLPSPSLGTVRVGVPTTIALDDLDEPVASAFQRVLSTLSARGAVIEEFAMPELAEIVRLNDKGGIAPPEALARHRDWISENSQAYDPRVLARILRGREQDAAEYIRLREARVQLIRRCQPIFAHFDALLMPTVPFVAPPIDSLADDAHYLRANALALRNPSFANFLDGCAISLPCHREGDAPVGCMLMAGTRADLWLLAIAAAVESAVESSHAK